VIPFLVLSCTSVNDSFLIKTLDDQAKSKALTQQGMEEYDLHLVHLQQFDQIPRIKQYFNVALSFDPTNAQAQQYLDMIDNFKNEKFQTNMDNATKVLAKPKRTDDDIYVLAMSLQTVAKIAPADPQVQKMMSDTAQDRAQLVTTYLDKSKAAMSSVDDKTPAATREKQYTEAFTDASKALDMDPKNATAQTQMTTAKTELGKMVALRVAAIQKLIGAGNFVEARTQVNALNDLNRKMTNSYDADVRNVSYSLNYSWASSSYTKKDYATADVRIDAAIAVNRTEEATALKKKITDARTKADAGVTFDVSVKEIDRLIGANELVAAHRRIDSLAKATTDQTKLAALNARSQTILGKLKDIYDQGVQAYHDEDFKTAIDRLQTVVGVAVDYEQASDYLDKAQSKQKVLDQLGG
jgi:tetratricopeptide (TPR) repeat protein